MYCNCLGFCVIPAGHWLYLCLLRIMAFITKPAAVKIQHLERRRVHLNEHVLYNKSNLYWRLVSVLLLAIGFQSSSVFRATGTFRYRMNQHILYSLISSTKLISAYIFLFGKKSRNTEKLIIPQY